MSRFWPALVGACLLWTMTVACSGNWFYDQSQWEGTTTHDVNGVALPGVFQAVPLPPPGTNVGQVTDQMLTTYHQQLSANEMYDLYGAHLRQAGWTEEAVSLSTGGRRFVKGGEELHLDASMMFGGGYGGGYAGYGLSGMPSQIMVEHRYRTLVAPWDTLGLPVEGARVRCTPTMLELSYAGMQAPSGGEQLNRLLRALVLAGWDVDTASPNDEYGTATVSRGSSRLDITLGSPDPGSVTIWYFGP